MKDIIFTLTYGNEWIPKEYYPVPADKIIPEWYKNMPTSYADKNDPYHVKQSQTIKRCLPVFDSMTTGYLLKTFTDVHIQKEDVGYSFQWAYDVEQTITTHQNFQIDGYKNKIYPNGVYKFRNPWSIKTPKGYSCLFIAPLHRQSLGITPMTAIVDTDVYVNSVQFPFIVDEGFEGTIPAGSPLVQVIPFKRDSFEMSIGDEKIREEDRKNHTLFLSSFINAYRNNYRVKKTYK